MKYKSKRPYNKYMDLNTISFGKYKNISWDKLSTEYLYGLVDMGNSEAFKELERRKNLPIEEQTVGFGKHIGKLWIELDNEYLHWIISTMEPNNDKVLLAFEAMEYKKENNITELDYSQTQAYIQEIDVIEID